jgi:hypothetical protein
MNAIVRMRGTVGKFKVDPDRSRVGIESNSKERGTET